MIADIYLLQKFARQELDGSSQIPWGGKVDLTAPTDTAPQYKGAY
jgi:hypothetical protein